MSGNQKQSATVGPQTQRYSTSPYQNISASSRTDYSVTAQQGPYVPQTQGPNQGPIRGIAPTGPPNQASTPPNTDIKVQSLPANTQMNHMFVQPQVPRPPQAQYFPRPSGPPSQTPRMPNQHNRQQQQMYPQTQYLLQSPTMYIANAMPFYSAGQRPNNFVQPVPMFATGQPLAASYPSFPNPQQVQQPPYFFNQTLMTRNPVPQPAPAQANPAQASIQNVPGLVAQVHPQQHPQYNQQQQQQRQNKNQNKRRERAIAVIDPVTGEDKLNEIFNNDEPLSSSAPPQPASGESSARQTPQPSVQQAATSKEIQAIFAKQVAQKISEDQIPQQQQQQQPPPQHQQQPQIHPYHPHIPSNVPGGEAPPSMAAMGMMEHGGEPQLQQQQYVHPAQPQAVPQTVRYDNIVQSSNLHINAKEFVSTSKTKETPIVSANSDAVEVIIPNKPKDRESPVKTRRQTSRDHKEPTLLSKEPPSVTTSAKGDSVICDNKTASSQLVKDDNKNETQAASMVTSNVTSAPAPVSYQPSAGPPSVGEPKETAAPISSVAPGFSSDKRNQKKPAPAFMETNKVPNIADNSPIESITITPSPAAVQQQMVPDLNAKSKQNTQRNAKQAPPAQPNHAKQSQQPQTVASVPQPQPSKPNNKTNKKWEININKFDKAGTDMDAFKDTLREINANIIASVDNPKENDIVNANSIVPPVNAVTPTAPPKVAPTVIDNANCNIETKDIESNDTTIKTAKTVDPQPPTLQQPQQINRIETAPTTIAPRPLVKAKEGFDITNIVREQPKPIKPFVPPVQPQNESQDETDRAALSTDKLVMAKNDVNAKGHTNNEADQGLKINYKPGQWSPSFPEGQKVYDRDILFHIKDLPASNLKPDNIPDIILIDERHRLSDGRLSMGGRTDFINPPFSGYGGGKSGSRGGMGGKRGSLSGKVNSRDKGAPKQEPQKLLKISLSLRGEVKLHESENAWRPARYNPNVNMTEDEKKTQVLYKKVRSVLNKLTPQKFNTLVKQVRDLNIDTKARLQGVIDLVFEKAIDEPNFSEAYSLMCKELQTMNVDLAGDQPIQDDQKKIVQFRTLLVIRCQQEFEKQSVDETAREKKVAEIDECTDPDKKKELEIELAEHDRRLRLRSVGTIRFIGELYKQHMLTSSIMCRCLQTLLDSGDEESLECLCKLLTTIGKELEQDKPMDIAKFFQKMREIIDGKRGKISSRIKFMLQDVQDLKQSKWVPRRQDLNPKTIDQITKEAETEQLNIQAMNAVPMTPRKDDRGGNMGGGPRQSRNKMNDDGWSSVSNTRNNRPSSFSIQTDKLRQNKTPLADEPLGSSLMFGSWGKGSTVKNQPPSLGTTNIYSALENIENVEKRPPNSRNKDPYSSKGPSMERSTYNRSYDGRGSRSGSQHRSDMSSSQRGSMGGPMSGPPPQLSSVVTPKPMAPPVSAPLPQQQQQSTWRLKEEQPAPLPTPAAVVPNLSEEQIERRVNNSLDEYLTGSCSADDYFKEICATVPQSYYSRLVGDSYIRVTEKNASTRRKTSCLFASLINSGKLPLQDFCAGFEDLLSQAEDLEIDIPRIWEYISEELVDLICQEALPLERLQKFLSNLRRQAPKVLVHLFRLIVSDKGPNFLGSLWVKSGLKLSDFMDENEVESFVQDNKLGFLIGGDAPVGQCQMSYEQIQSKLSEFLRSKTPFDDIVNWITANVGDRVEDNKFIRTLATSIFENSITKNKLVPETLQEHFRLIQKYVDNKHNYELQCLFALQSLVHKLEHPQGLLLSIFNRLYEENVISQESFIAYQNSNDPAAEQEGKGVALKQLTSFFTQLMENEDDEYGSSSTSEDA